MLNISGIHEGVVIDHIKAGGAMRIYEYLNLENYDYTVAIIKNATSHAMGRKDIIKIEGPLDNVNLNVLGVINKKITINIIKNDKIVEKGKLDLPEYVTNVIRCKNPRCITSIEQGLEHKFKLTNRSQGTYRCVYCETKFTDK